MSNQVKGKIAYYNLTEWWLSTFTYDERQYIVGQYIRNGRPNDLTEMEIRTTGEVTSFLNGLATWFRLKQDTAIREKILQKMRELAIEQPVSKPGYYKGRHYSTYPEDVKNLKRQGKLEEAEKLLLDLVMANELQAAVDGMHVAPWYYRELAKIYRKRRNYAAEVDILEQYFTHGHRRSEMVERLKKAKELLDKHK